MAEKNTVPSLGAKAQTRIRYLHLDSGLKVNTNTQMSRTRRQLYPMRQERTLCESMQTELQQQPTCETAYSKRNE